MLGVVISFLHAQSHVNLIPIQLADEKAEAVSHWVTGLFVQNLDLRHLPLKVWPMDQRHQHHLEILFLNAESQAPPLTYLTSVSI